MDTIALFTKHDGSPQQILHDLQCTWYEAEAGECYERTRTWGMALKKYHAVLQNYEDYSKDAFDFHGFALRKVRSSKSSFLLTQFFISFSCLFSL